MIPFVIWSVPLFLVYHNVDNIWDYVLYPNKGYWFLWALFFIIIIYTVVDWACRKLHFKQEIAMGVVAIGLIGVQMVLPDAKLLGYEYVAYYFIFYMMGYYANKYKEYLPSQTWLIWSIFVLWALMACFWTPNGTPFFLQSIPVVPAKLLQLGYRMLTSVVFILWMYAAAPKMKVGKNWIWRRLIELGQISLGVYVAHMVVKNLFAQILSDTLPMLPILVHVAIEFVVLTILSVAVVRLIMRNRFLAKWLLGKA